MINQSIPNKNTKWTVVSGIDCDFFKLRLVNRGDQPVPLVSDPCVPLYHFFSFFKETPFLFIRYSPPLAVGDAVLVREFPVTLWLRWNLFRIGDDESIWIAASVSLLVLPLRFIVVLLLWLLPLVTLLVVDIDLIEFNLFDCSHLSHPS